eukprot:GILI01016486.1.p1 GENE.GILI01016486.1~~GILI01016486.1.p1  ORF type:complete len:133 (+),score=20.14 GILI01016486.1:52-399(+)
MSMMWKSVMIVGFVLLLHSAYSAIQHRQDVRLAGLGPEFEALSADIILEVFFGFLLATAGGIGISGTFLPIHSGSVFSPKTADTTMGHPDFASFNHRGKYLASIIAQHVPAPSPK